MRPDILPGDTSEKAKETRRKLRAEVIKKLTTLETQASKLRERIEDFPCLRCGYGSCPKDCW